MCRAQHLDVFQSANLHKNLYFCIFSHQNIMKNKTLLFAAVLLLMAACTHTNTNTNTNTDIKETPQFKVSVNLSNTGSKKIYLQKNGQILDSASFINQKAEFHTPVCADNEVYSLTMKGWRRPFDFFADNKDVTIEGDAQQSKSITVKASESQDRMMAFVMCNDTLEDEIVKEHCFSFVCDHPTDPVAHYLMYRYKWAFTLDELHTMIEAIHQADKNIVSHRLQMTEEYVEKQDRVQPGHPMIDFTQNDPDGNPITLSQLAEGKLLLVDFWASWCPDCRKANPDVVAAYQKYHDRGFDVLGVSFDTNKEAWLAAVENDGLTWTQVSDLQGWNNAAGVLYSIAFIPQNALIKDGMIVARNLEGEELMKEIERQLQ